MTLRRNLPNGPSTRPSLAPKSALMWDNSKAGHSELMIGWIFGSYFWFRDPRRVFAFVKRRRNSDLAHWSRENREFCDFITASGIPSAAVSYGLGRVSQARLVEFCGMRFIRDSLSYDQRWHAALASAESARSRAMSRSRTFSTRIGAHRKGVGRVDVSGQCPY
jgi:hypothetical protein